MNNSHLIAIMARLVVIGLGSSAVVEPDNTAIFNIVHRNDGTSIVPSNSESELPLNSYAYNNQSEQTGQNSPGTLAYLPAKGQPNPSNPENVLQESYVYPNPNNGYFVVQLPLSINGQKGTIQVYDHSANEIYSSDFIPENGNKIIVDLGGKDPGIYFLVIQTAGERKMSKFLIH